MLHISTLLFTLKVPNIQGKKVVSIDSILGFLYAILYNRIYQLHLLLSTCHSLSKNCAIENECSISLGGATILLALFSLCANYAQNNILGQIQEYLWALKMQREGRDRVKTWLGRQCTHMYKNGIKKFKIELIETA